MRGFAMPGRGRDVEENLATRASAPLQRPGIDGAPFLRIPPFPGSRVDRFVEAAGPAQAVPTDRLVERIRALRVGGTYWGAQPGLPAEYLLLRTAAPSDACDAVAPGCARVLWNVRQAPANSADGTMVVRGDCDPWHMLDGAAGLIVEPGDEIRVVAAILGVPTWVHDPRKGELAAQADEAAILLEQALSGGPFENPFGGEPISFAEAIELCGFWRKLIDSNRDISAGIGFAFWKQDNVAPLLWSGKSPFPFVRKLPEPAPSGPLAIWRSRTSREATAALERSGVPLVEVEDGFLRSRGLGADCVPPLSIIVDRLGAYFDPGEPSELEVLLEDGKFDLELVARARALRLAIVAAGLGKYDRGDRLLERPAGDRRHILVPGQVEDDRSVRAGGCGIRTNLELLERVREQAPDAYILYKPHPDVVAGHRTGAIQDRNCLEHADRIVSDLPISSLIAMVDEVHVNTSLAGFEALMREKKVTTYGVPFYAGWGLTRDLGPVPERRTARRTVDELVAAALLLYPRYLDPLTGLPCPAEVVVERLAAGEASDGGLVVAVRRMQGKLMRRFRSLAS